MLTWADGTFLPSPPPLATGIAPFETMGAANGHLPLWDRHLARLAAAAARLALPFAPPTALQPAALELLRRNGHQDGVLRLQLCPFGHGASWRLRSRSRSTSRLPLRLIPTVARRPPGAPPADLKCDPRDHPDAVLAEARASGADDGIVLGDDGSLLETAVGNLWLLLDSVWATPPLDGRLLPGIARALLLERARASGLTVVERPCDLADLHRAAALLVSNAVHGPRPAALLGSPVGESDTRLLALWHPARRNGSSTPPGNADTEA